MALQWSQLLVPTSTRVDSIPKVAAAPSRRLTCGSSALQNSHFALQLRISGHCKRDITSTRKVARHGRRRSVCVRAVRNDPKPTYVEMTPITSEAQFNEILEPGSRVIIDWMATWCRKCIYLKPKLEKLAAEYYPGVTFYCVDVNTVPSSLVTRAQVTKMPTIQLWKDKEKVGEVIGGDQAWSVMEKIREMLK